MRKSTSASRCCFFTSQYCAMTGDSRSEGESGAGGRSLAEGPMRSGLLGSYQAPGETARRQLFAPEALSRVAAVEWADLDAIETAPAVVNLLQLHVLHLTRHAFAAAQRVGALREGSHLQRH